MRHTKIIATLGPASDRDDILEQLILAGVDVVRLNFSHGSHDWHAAAFARIRRAAERAGRVVAIMQDLSGPKIRTGPLVGNQPIQLSAGDVLHIVTGDFVGSGRRVSTAYAELARAVRPGDRLLLDDGRVELRVEETDGVTIATKVIDGGELRSHMGINAPGVTLPASAMTQKDVEDLEFGVALGVDVVAVSFVQTAADLRRARELISAAGGANLPIVAKIERPQAVANLNEILDHSDAVMVARGDLGLEVPLERVPRLQKEITRTARSRGIPVIVATQVFESMRIEPRPTRAEVSDAANAVGDSVDAIMLAGETAVGRYPVRAVQTLDSVIRDAEAIALPAASMSRTTVVSTVEHGFALCEAAVTLATSGQADAIVAVTRGGRTARMLSAMRPTAMIYATSETDATARALTLLHGVVPLASGIAASMDSTQERIEDQLLSRGILPPGAVVVCVSVSPDLSRRDANFLQLRRLGS
jgi:pyruvate kinase